MEQIPDSFQQLKSYGADALEAEVGTRANTFRLLRRADVKAIASDVLCAARREASPLQRADSII